MRPCHVFCFFASPSHADYINLVVLVCLRLIAVLHSEIVTIFDSVLKKSYHFQPGVGCSKSHADNWIAHQDGFDELLSSLNNGPSSSATGGKETSAVSLEEKSRSSRSRVQ